MSLKELLTQNKIVVSCGTGGVGKTTMSATLAIKAAVLGKNVLVVTVDPARRLATSLGVENLGETPLDLTENLARVYEKKTGEKLLGRLTAVMPNARSALEGFVNKLSNNPAMAEKITKNPIFKIISQEFSGTQDYMALERLYTFHSEGGFDLIILDTPPSRNTLAFLDAPERLIRFLEDRLLKWITLPGGSLFSFGLKKALSLLERLTGSQFIPQLVEFAHGLMDLKTRFTTKLALILGVLRAEGSVFVLVAAPAPEMLDEIDLFLESIEKHGFHMSGMIVNRTIGKMDMNDAPAQDPAYDILRALMKKEARFFEDLKKHEKLKPIAEIHELKRDLHSIEDLLDVAIAIQ